MTKSQAAKTMTPVAMHQNLLLSFTFACGGLFLVHTPVSAQADDSQQLMRELTRAFQEGKIGVAPPRTGSLLHDAGVPLGAQAPSASPLRTLGVSLAQQPLLTVPSEAVGDGTSPTVKSVTLSKLGLDAKKMEARGVVVAGSTSGVSGSFLLIRSGATKERLANLDPALVADFEAAFAKNPNLSAIAVGATAAGLTIVGIHAVAADDSWLMRNKFLIGIAVGLLLGVGAWVVFRKG